MEIPREISTLVSIHALRSSELFCFVDAPAVRSLVHENVEQFFGVVDVPDGEAVDSEPDRSEVGLQERVDLHAPHVGEAVFGRECGLGNIHFPSSRHSYWSGACYCW